MAKPATAQRTNLSSILSKAPSEVERPKPYPVGSYVTLVQGMPRFDKSSKKQTEFVEFTLKFLAAGEDVDEADLASMGGIKEKTIKATYYLTETALWRLKEFLEACGIDVDNAESFQAAIEKTPGKQVGIFVTHEAGNDGESIFARVGKPFAVE